MNDYDGRMTVTRAMDIREDLAEHLAELDAQHRSETALFGDSWPGAQLTLAALREDIHLLDRSILAAINAYEETS